MQKGERGTAMVSTHVVTFAARAHRSAVNVMTLNYGDTPVKCQPAMTLHDQPCYIAVFLKGLGHTMDSAIYSNGLHSPMVAP